MSIYLKLVECFYRHFSSFRCLNRRALVIQNCNFGITSYEVIWVFPHAMVGDPVKVTTWFLSIKLLEEQLCNTKAKLWPSTSKVYFIFASSYNSTKCPLIVHQYFAVSLWFIGERQEVKLSARAEVEFILRFYWNYWNLIKLDLLQVDVCSILRLFIFLKTEARRQFSSSPWRGRAS